MPLYDYKCRECGQMFESLEKMDTETISCHGTEEVPCAGTADHQVSRPRHFDKLGDNANLSSVRFNFNWIDGQ